MAEAGLFLVAPRSPIGQDDDALRLKLSFLAVLTIAGASALLLPSGVAHAQRYEDPAGRGDYRDGPGRGAPDPGERPEEYDDGPPPPADPAYRGQTDYRQPPPAYRDEPRDRGDVAEESRPR